jgi:hypothetical protein
MREDLRKDEALLKKYAKERVAEMVRLVETAEQDGWPRISRFLVLEPGLRLIPLPSFDQWEHFPLAGAALNESEPSFQDVK